MDDKVNELLKLKKQIGEARYELHHDPEDCFGGRGNNFGEGFVESLEDKYAEILKSLSPRESRDFGRAIGLVQHEPAESCQVCYPNAIAEDHYHEGHRIEKCKVCGKYQKICSPHQH
jgi:hypothetical protein